MPHIDRPPNAWFGQVAIEAIHDRSISRGARWLYSDFCAHRKTETGRCRRSLHKIAAKEGVTLRTVQNWRRELEDAGWIVTLRNRGRTAEFYVVMDPNRRDWARNENNRNLGQTRSMSAEFGKRGATLRKLEKSSAEANVNSPPGETDLTATEVNIVSPRTESIEQNNVNREAEDDLSKHASGNSNEIAEQLLAGDQARLSAQHDQGYAISQSFDDEQAFRGLDCNSWGEWLRSTWRVEAPVLWLIESVDKVSLATGMNAEESEQFVDRVMRKVRAHGGLLNPALALDEAIAEEVSRSIEGPLKEQ